MPWNEVDVQEQRIRFAVLAEEGERTMAELCREFGISRQAGYKWRRRYREGGVKGLAERGRRPHRSPRKTPEQIEERCPDNNLSTMSWNLTAQPCATVGMLSPETRTSVRVLEGRFVRLRPQARDTPELD